jgi:GR25 family glycosyltransferase involved in LPS biosynthesis
MSYINTLVDKVYVINLEKDKERLKKIDSSLQREKVDYERIPGVIGSQIGYDNRISFLCNTFCTDGIKGCALSHHKVWEQMLKNGYSSILVFEDDAIIPEGFDEKVRNVMSKLPNDYDVVFLGCHFFCDSKSVIQKTYQKLTNTEPKQFAEDIQQVQGSMGTHAILYTRSFVQKIVSEPITTHIDIELRRWIKNYNAKAYGVNPEIVDTKIEQGGSNLADGFPPLANTVLRNIDLVEKVPLSWTLSENLFKIGPLNVNFYLIFLFLLGILVPYWVAGLLGLWIIIEALVASSAMNGVRYGVFLGLGMLVGATLGNLKDGLEDVKRSLRRRK